MKTWARRLLLVTNPHNQMTKEQEKQTRAARTYTPKTKTYYFGILNAGWWRPACAPVIQLAIFFSMEFLRMQNTALQRISVG